MKNLEPEIKRLGMSMGATAVGISQVSRLPRLPSADTGHMLPGTRSMVSIMVHYQEDIVARYLGKLDWRSLHRHETELYGKLDRIARALVRLLLHRGHRAVAGEPNLDYRYKSRLGYRVVPHRFKQALADWLASDSIPPVQRAKRALAPRLYSWALRTTGWRLTPGFSHRYGAVACGLGVLGWSGNLLHPDHGARVLCNTVLTGADLQSDEMLTAEVCDGCRLCARSCQSGFVRLKERDHVDIGGRRFVHNRKASNLRCIMVCGGFSGQSRFPEWSTWSKGRVALPEDDADLQRSWDQLVANHLGYENHHSGTLADLLYHSEYGYVRKLKERFRTTCGYCQFVCAPTSNRRRELYELLTSA